LCSHWKFAVIRSRVIVDEESIDRPVEAWLDSRKEGVLLYLWDFLCLSKRRATDHISSDFCKFRDLIISNDPIRPILIDSKSCNDSTKMFHIKISLALAVLLPHFATATPSPAEIVPRSTCTKWPNEQSYISEASPNTTYTPNSGIFQVQ
jgi:hypothetical protein